MKLIDHRVLVTPVGPIDPALLTHIRRAVEACFGLDTGMVDLLSNIEFAYHPDRRQYHTTPVLEQLAEKAPHNAAKILAVTDVDLFIPILTHVYGEAQLGGRACIVSTYRLRTPSERAAAGAGPFDRIIKESIHELGHTFQLRHCPETSCIMHYCRSEADVDKKSDQLCRYCRIMLADELKRLQMVQV